MQSAEGHLELSPDLRKLWEKSARKERETGKPHPVFTKGEELEIKGGRFKVHQLLKDRLILKPIKY